MLIGYMMEYLIEKGDFVFQGRLTDSIEELYKKLEGEVEAK